MAITKVSPKDPLLQWINNNATSIADATAYLEANLNVPGSELFQDIAVYLAASTNPKVNSSAGQTLTPPTTSSGLSLTTIFGVVTGVASAAGMAKFFLPKTGLDPALMASLQSAIKTVGTGALAAFLQYKVFAQSEKTAEQAQTANILELGGLAALADAATMLWLASFNHANANYDQGAYSVIQGMPIFSRLMDIIKHGHFTINPFDPFFWFTLATASAITAAVVTAGVLVGRNGSSDVPISPTAAAVQSELSQIPDFTQILPKSSVMFLTAGLTLGTLSYNVTPTNLSNQFPVPTVTLAAALGTTPGGLANEIFVYKGGGPNGSDTVYLVTPGPNGMSRVSMFAVDANGYIIGNNGPDTNDLPFFQPTVNGSGHVAGVKYNEGAQNAFLQIPACMTIANDTTMSAHKREAALETCMRANKDVQFIPSPNN